MNRPWKIWVSFAACLAVVLCAMGWMSWQALELEDARTLARRQAEQEERVRLALWRMDSAISPLIARENARPYFTYSAFYPAGRSYNRMFVEIQKGEVLLPSPLLTASQEDILLHFQIEPDGQLTSPKVPTGNKRDLAEAGYTTHQKINDAHALLGRLAEHIDKPALLGAKATERIVVAAQPPVPSAQTDGGSALSQSLQYKLNTIELLARRQSQQRADRQIAQTEATNVAQILATEVSYEAMRPVWTKGALLLVRKVKAEGNSYVQGCWLNWDRIRTSLLAEVGNLLPDAELQPTTVTCSDKTDRLLASLPVRLLPGEVASSTGNGFSPIVLSLIVAWVCVLTAAGAVAMLLLGAVSLSERRGAFVSAVTHELRTPLTTFRMYTEMLEGDMVAEESRKKEYLGTLRTEAERLGHLVENVLAYARLEKGRARGRIEQVTLGEMIGRVAPLLGGRAGQAGMELVVENGEETDTVVLADASAVEQILFNLVDNACKYAVGADDRRIHLKTRKATDAAELCVCDHGPGISDGDARKLFRPFSKSAHEAANSAPGVGLGLALSRRLARQMHGDLTLDGNAPAGACFVLTLPLA